MAIALRQLHVHCQKHIIFICHFIWDQLLWDNLLSSLSSSKNAVPPDEFPFLNWLQILPVMVEVLPKSFHCAVMNQELYYIKPTLSSG